MIITIFGAIHYRWILLIKERKIIRSIMALISFESVKQNQILTKEFK
jgi:hypothetical protein